MSSRKSPVLRIFLIICFDIADGYAFFSRFSAESVLTFCRRDRFRKKCVFHGDGMRRLCAGIISV